ncbi:MAG: alpha/beta fold hydrolase [Xenococcaceae cyanobacterium]
MASPPTFYTWKNFRCAYEVHTPKESSEDSPALLLIHPIGVGLSNFFWHRFCEAWFKGGQRHRIYNPDLLGCGASDMPRIAYYPSDWAQQLQYFLQTVVKIPVIVVVQGALLPVAIALIQNQPQPNLIRGLVMAGPPAWELMGAQGNPWKQRIAWNLFDSPVGAAFYRYARRRQFLQSFSIRQLFAQAEAVDDQWLDALQKGAVNPNSRHAVFSFLSGFWRQDYSQSIAEISQPTLVVVGEKASSISRTGTSETPEERIALYLKHLPNGQGCKIPGRNVLPYESTNEFVSVVAEFVHQLTKEF